MRCENVPGNKVFDVVVFEGPDMLAEFGGVSVFGVFFLPYIYIYIFIIHQIFLPARDWP